MKTSIGFLEVVFELMAGKEGLEPSTARLTAAYSAVELLTSGRITATRTPDDLSFHG
jgi:hypothetical protein